MILQLPIEVIEKCMWCYRDYMMLRMTCKYLFQLKDWDDIKDIKYYFGEKQVSRQALMGNIHMLSSGNITWNNNIVTILFDGSYINLNGLKILTMRGVPCSNVYSNTSGYYIYKTADSDKFIFFLYYNYPEFYIKWELIEIFKLDKY